MELAMVEEPQEEIGYLSIKQAADLLGVNTSALYQAIHSGRLTTYRVLDKRVLKRADVEAYRPRAYRNRPRIALRDTALNNT
jgi:excisionase family DNA binding protein